MIRHIGLSDWIRRDFSEELDLVGPVARDVMERHGLPYPYNLHLLVPMIEAAGGGSLVTGLGGDQALNPAGRALNVVARRTAGRLKRALASLELESIVDPRALAEQWAAPAPLANSFLLLQACWFTLQSQA